MDNHTEKITMTDKHKNIHSGHSMVEMLGVLAIIGVLSVGAIAGYSKAMLKHKLNKQAQQISTILNGDIAIADKLSLRPLLIRELLRSKTSLPCILN